MADLLMALELNKKSILLFVYDMYNIIDKLLMLFNVI